MDLTFNLTQHQFTNICVVALVALAVNFSYNVCKSESNVLITELLIATIAAEGLILGLWFLVGAK